MLVRFYYVKLEDIIYYSIVNSSYAGICIPVCKMHYVF